MDRPCVVGRRVNGPSVVRVSRCGSPASTYESFLALRRKQKSSRHATTMAPKAMPGTKPAAKDEPENDLAGELEAGNPSATEPVGTAVIGERGLLDVVPAEFELVEAPADGDAFDADRLAEVAPVVTTGEEADGDVDVGAAEIDAAGTGAEFAWQMPLEQE